MNQFISPSPLFSCPPQPIVIFENISAFFPLSVSGTLALFVWLVRTCVGVLLDYETHLAHKRSRLQVPYALLLLLFSLVLPNR